MVVNTLVLVEVAGRRRPWRWKEVVNGMVMKGYGGGELALEEVQ